MSKTNENPKAPDLWERISMLLSMPEAQAAIRTDMEFSVAETKYILERLHQLSSDTLKLSESGYDAEICRVAAEELAAEIVVVEKANALSENGKYVISMNFREMDAFLDAFRIERETFKGWTYIEIYQKKQYVDVVTDIDERFKPVYNQRWDGLMSISARMPVKADVEDSDDEVDYESTLAIESVLEKDIDIELAATDTESMLTCLLRAKEFYEYIGADDSEDDETKASYNESVVMLLQIIAKIEAAESVSVSATYTVLITFLELEKILAALQCGFSMMQFKTDAEILSEKKYYDTIEAVFDLLEFVYLAGMFSSARSQAAIRTNMELTEMKLTEADTNYILECLNNLKMQHNFHPMPNRDPRKIPNT